MNRSGKSYYWLFQLGGWGSFAVINTFFAYSFDKLKDPQDIQVYFGRLGIFVLLGLVASHIMRLCIIRMNILQKNFNKQVLEFLMITVFFSLMAAFVYMNMLERGNGFVGLISKALGSVNADTPELISKSERQIGEKSRFLLVLYFGFSFFSLIVIWNLIYFMYHYVTKSRKQQLDTLQLEALVKELELQTIKAHINPHFIFNALNSIRALIDENPDRARTAVTELSNILRSSLKAEKGETVTFCDELKIVKDYLALENMRFEDRLKVEFQIDDETLDQQVPPMMLQTLVENAIKHGISKQINGGVVKVISDFENDYHLLAVQNTGHLNGNTNKTGFGLSSTQDRLQLLYGEKARFQIRQLNPFLVEARVLIPSH
jgi:two-component system, LytTR family, sensor kinase